MSDGTVGHRESKVGDRKVEKEISYSKLIIERLDRLPRSLTHIFLPRFINGSQYLLCGSYQKCFDEVRP